MEDILKTFWVAIKPNTWGANTCMTFKEKDDKMESCDQVCACAADGSYITTIAQLSAIWDAINARHYLRGMTILKKLNFMKYNIEI